MANSKVVLNGTTLIDLTQDTVTADYMIYGITAHKNDGTVATGTIVTKTSTDVSVSGDTVSAPAGIKIGTGYYSETYYLAQAPSGTLTIGTTSDAGTDINCAAYSNVNLTGINIPAGKSFSVKIPNGEGTITFTFTVDSSGNTTVTES